MDLNNIIFNDSLLTLIVRSLSSFTNKWWISDSGTEHIPTNFTITIMGRYPYYYCSSYSSMLVLFLTVLVLFLYIISYHSRQKASVFALSKLFPTSHKRQNRITNNNKNHGNNIKNQDNENKKRRFPWKVRKQQQREITSNETSTTPNDNNDNDAAAYDGHNNPVLSFIKKRKVREPDDDSNNDGKNDDDDDDDESSSNTWPLLLQQRVEDVKRVKDNIAQMLRTSYDAATETATSAAFRILPKSNKTLSSWSFWEDLTFSAPFHLLLPQEDNDNFWSELENDEEYYYDNGIQTTTSTIGNNTTLTTTSATTPTTTIVLPLLPNTTTITHFCFLLHGFRGLSRDLAYMQAMMKKQARMEQYKRYVKIRRLIQQQAEDQEIEKHGKHNSLGEDDVGMMQNVEMEFADPNISPIESMEEDEMEGDRICHVVQDAEHEIEGKKKDDDNHQNGMDDNNKKNNEFVLHDLVVHSVTCNERKTDDGVAAGGNRVVDEIIEFVQEYMTNKTKQTHVQQPHGNEDNDDEEEGLMDITISLVGNSLGGLYARYAAAELTKRYNCTTGNYDSNQHATTTTTMILDNRYRLHWNIFCTTATPHLGLSGHTFVPLPRTAEFGVARALGETGRDLFRFNNLLHDMATDPIFLQPMGLFRKRIAYANAYGTDFPVPASTAAFLSESSTYPHHFVNNQQSEEQSEDDPFRDNTDLDDDKNKSNNNKSRSSTLVNGVSRSNEPTSSGGSDKAGNHSLFVATLRTPSFKESPHIAHHHDHVVTQNSDDGEEESSGEDINNELARMSTALDSLGWKKVFVDVRKEVPRISISKSLLRGRIPGISLDSSNNINNDDDSSSSDTSMASHQDTGGEVSSTATSSNNDTATTGNTLPIPTNSKCIHQLKEKGVVSSKDVVAAVSTTPWLSSDNNEISFHWPAGHNMIVAFSRSRWSAYMNKAGRPVVDSLAKELVEDIFAFHYSEDVSTAKE